MYEKQGFHSGEKLKATQLVAMEDGIIEAQQLAQEGAAGAENMEKGSGEGSSQQKPDTSRVTDGKWDFNSDGSSRNPNAAASDAQFSGMQDYGATGIYSATFGGSNKASGGRSFAVNNRTIAAGDESMAQGYCSVAKGSSSFAGGSKTYAVGEASVSLGDSTQAFGKCSVAIGSNTGADGQNAIATGDRTVANGINSYAGGFQSVAEGAGAFVHGYNVCTHEEYGTVFGRNNIATEGANFTIGNGINEPSNAFVSWIDGRASVYGAPKNDEDVIRKIDLFTVADNVMQQVDENYSNAPIKIGDGDYSVQQFNNFATNSHSSAFGNNTTASGENSYAQGSSNEASGYCSFVGGQQSKAAGNTATAIGLGVKAEYDRQVAIGQFNENKSNTIFEVGGGHADDNRLNVFEVCLDGLVGVGKKVQQLPDGVAGGFDFTGKNTNATALDATLTGVIPYGATGDFASAFGGKCAAQGKRSMAQGTTTIAKGKYSHAEGDNSVAIGDDSHAEGAVTVSKGWAAHSEGNTTKAIGDFSHAEGCETITEGNASHAEGHQTKASGYAAHAAGDRTEAKGIASYAGGTNTIAGYDYQTVVGKYNANKADTVFEVGTGYGDDSRVNGFEVYSNGDIGIRDIASGYIFSLQAILRKLKENVFDAADDSIILSKNG